METSIRYGGDSKSIRFHAKEKLRFAADTILQLNGEIDTGIGTPTCLNSMIRYFSRDSSASLGVGIQYQYDEDMAHFNIRGKKAFPVTSDESLSFNVKGRCYIEEKFKEVKYTGGAEFVWSIFNFKKDQDLRLKVGYDVVDQIPYLQIRENNWTFNADGNRRWNVRYDL